MAYHRDYRVMLRNPALDGVIIVSPTPLHARMAIDALERGMPTLVEKAVAHSMQAGRQLAAVADRTRCKIAVAHTLRYEPFVGRMREALAELGTLRSLSIRHRSPVSTEGRRYPFDGALLGGGVHYFDLLVHLGLCSLDHARFESGALDARAFRIRWQQEQTVFDLDLAWGAPEREELIRIEGHGGVIEVRRFEEPRAPSIPPLLAAFRDYLADQAGPPASLAEGLEALRWVESVGHFLCS